MSEIFKLSSSLILSSLIIIFWYSFQHLVTKAVSVLMLQNELKVCKDNELGGLKNLFFKSALQRCRNSYKKARAGYFMAPSIC